MNLFAISNLLNSVLCMIVAVFALIAGRNRIYRLLMVFYILCAGWSFGAYLTTVFSAVEFKVLSWKLAYGAGFFLAPAFYHLASIIGESKKDHFILFAYGQAALFTLLSMVTPLIIPAHLNKVWDIDFPAQNVFLSSGITAYFFIATVTYIKLIHIFKTSNGRKREQALFFFWGCLLGFIGGTISLLPVFNVLFRPALGGSLGILISAMLIIYGMLRINILELEELVKAAHREKLVALGTLATSINHEIRNPLYIIQGLAQSYLANFREGLFLNKETALNKAEEVFQKAERQASRAMDIMKRFAMFAKQDAVPPDQPAPVDLNSVLADVLPLVSHELELAKIELGQHISPNLPPVQATRRYLEEILFNLIVNACQAIKACRSEESAALQPASFGSSLYEAQSVACHLERIEEFRTQGRIEIHATQQNNYINILIKDNGPGMDASQLSKIFEPFYTTKGEGTGLGLYITKQLVQKNNGKISVKSRMGEGTVFALEFKR